MKRADHVRQGVAHLRTADPVMKRLIDATGPFLLRPNRDRFGTLARSIMSQQISTSAARSIRQRLTELLPPDGLTPENLVRSSEARLRSAGLSRPKASYLRDLAQKTLDGTVRLDRIGRLPDEDVIGMLTQVRGIGRWTAEMFLMFSLGRLDVLPCDDLGIRSSIKSFYCLDGLPDKNTCIRIAAPWRPYATIACWYCWRSLDRQREAQQAKPAS